MMDWLTAGQTLPRYVVWTLLLTHPAAWAGLLWKVVRKRIGGAARQAERQRETES